MEDKRVIKDTCEQYYVVVPGHSWTTFTISPKGDFFIYGDWGYWAYNWRAFGADFKLFLVGINEHYLLSNLESNEAMFNKKKMSSRAKVAITELFKAFQEELKKDTVSVTSAPL